MESEMEANGNKLVRLVFHLDLPHCGSKSPKTWFVVNPETRTFGDLISVIREEFGIESGIRLCDQNGFTIPPQVPLDELNRIGEPLFSVFPIDEDAMDEDYVRPDMRTPETDKMTTAETGNIPAAASTPNSPSGNQENRMMMLLLSPIRGSSNQGSISMNSLPQRQQTVKPQASAFGLDSTTSGSTQSPPQVKGPEQSKSPGLRARLTKAESFGSSSVGTDLERLEFDINIEGHISRRRRRETMLPQTPVKRMKFMLDALKKICSSPERSWVPVSLPEVQHIGVGTQIAFKYEEDGEQREMTGAFMGTSRSRGFASLFVKKAEGAPMKTFRLNKVSDVRKLTEPGV